MNIETNEGCKIAKKIFGIYVYPFSLSPSNIIATAALNRSVTFKCRTPME